MKRDRLSLSIAALATALTLLIACGRQQEGERCDTAAEFGGGDSDCADGLVCVSRGNVGAEVCCPPEDDPDGASDPACLSDETTSSTTTGAGGNGGDGDGGMGGDGGIGGDAGMGGMGGDAGMGGTAGGGGTGGA